MFESIFDMFEIGHMNGFSKRKLHFSPEPNYQKKKNYFCIPCIPHPMEIILMNLMPPHPSNVEVEKTQSCNFIEFPKNVISSNLPIYSLANSRVIQIVKYAGV